MFVVDRGSGASVVPAGKWSVDAPRSSVAFAVKHMMFATVNESLPRVRWDVGDRVRRPAGDGNGQGRLDRHERGGARRAPTELELHGELNRRDFGLTWNQALETGGALLGNKVKIALEIAAARR
jgi:polyisoprenoid-binding protein YceI